MAANSVSSGVSCVPPPCGRTFDGGISGSAISHSPSGTIQLHVPRPMLSPTTNSPHRTLSKTSFPLVPAGLDETWTVLLSSWCQMSCGSFFGGWYGRRWCIGRRVGDVGGSGTVRCWPDRVRGDVGLHLAASAGLRGLLANGVQAVRAWSRERV